MNDQYSFNKLDSLLFQCALRTRELSQKKNELIQQIKVFRADIAERKAYIGTLRKDIEKLEQDIFWKQGTLKGNKARTKRIKTLNHLLLQYEQKLKEDLESRQANYKDDLVHHEERIANYKKILQNHKDFYYNSPLAQELITLQAEKEEIESRIKACDDQIIMAQKELDMLAGPAAASSPEKPSASISRMQLAAEPEKQLAPQAEEGSDSFIDISSLHLNLQTDGQEITMDETVEETCEENKVQDYTTDNPVEEEEEFNDQRWTDLIHSEDENQEAKLEDQEPQSAQSDIEEAVEEEKEEEDVAEETEQAPPEGDTERPTPFPRLSAQETHPQSSPATVKAAPATPTFPFNFSPASSPRQGTSDTKSPAFMFSLNPDPSTPGFSGFGFDVGSSQDEDSSFAFTGQFFPEKKNTASQSLSCTEFPFGQPEQSQDFQFAFTAKSPQTTKTDNSGDDFPFSFNF